MQTQADFYYNRAMSHGKSASEAQDKKDYEKYHLYMVRSSEELSIAAKLGHAEAQYQMAVRLEAGAAGVKQDYNQALKLYKAAAEQNHEGAKEFMKLHAEATASKSSSKPSR